MLPNLYGYGQIAAAQSVALTDPLIQAALANSTASTNSSTSETVATGSRDTTLTKIFVGGLPYHTTDQTLHDYFRQFGEIEEAVVITDRQTNKSRGYGFVTMKERADAEKACKDPNPIIDGRKANVNLAYLGAKPRNNVHLAALSSSLQQLPIQAQLQAAALMPNASAGRIGLPQLYLQNALQNPLSAQLVNHPAFGAAAQLQPAALAAAMAQAQAQNLAVTSQASLVGLQQHLQQQQSQQQAGAAQYFDYNQLLMAAAAAANHNNAAAFGMPGVSNGLDQYAAAYQLGVLPNTNSYAAQLAAQAQLQAVAASSAAGHHYDGGQAARLKLE